MFVEGSISTELLQGDICEISAFPSWDVKTAAEVGPKDAAPTHLQMPVHARVARGDRDGALVMVLSHSCDIENPRTRTALVVAPLVPVPAGQHSEADRYDQIIRSHSPVDGVFDYLNFFPVLLPGRSDWNVVDFSNLMTMGRAMQAGDLLTKAKLAQLTDDMRAALQTKLAVWIGAPDRAMAAPPDAAAGVPVTEPAPLDGQPADRKDPDVKAVGGVDDHA